MYFCYHVYLGESIKGFGEGQERERTGKSIDVFTIEKSVMGRSVPLTPTNSACHSPTTTYRDGKF